MPIIPYPTEMQDPEANADEKAPFLLTQKILARSYADNWQEAKDEWELKEVFFADPDQPGTCLCGHFPIVENCVLRNRETGRTAVVGNVCVTKFLEIDSDTLFQALRRIAADPKKALNLAAIEFAYRRGWLTSWDRKFCLDTCRKRKLSPRQREIRAAINAKVIASVMASGREVVHA